MSDLKPCPFCGGEACENEHKFVGYTSTFGVVCLDCCAETRQFYNTSEEAIAAWNRRAEPENEPLTLEELRKMRGQVVDIPESEFWYSGRGTVLDDGVYDPKDQDAYWPFKYYGEWLAYRQKPERSEG